MQVPYITLCGFIKGGCHMLLIPFHIVINLVLCGFLVVWSLNKGALNHEEARNHKEFESQGNKPAHVFCVWKEMKCWAVISELDLLLSSRGFSLQSNFHPTSLCHSWAQLITLGVHPLGGTLVFIWQTCVNIQHVPEQRRSRNSLWLPPISSKELCLNPVSRLPEYYPRISF